MSAQIAALTARQNNREPELSVVKKPRLNNNFRSMVTLLTVVMILALIGALWLRVVTVTRQHDINELRASIQEMQEQTNELQNKLATLESPARIRTAASAIGMVEPPEVAYVQASIEPLNLAEIADARASLLGG